MKNNCVEILKAVMAFLSMIYKDRALIYQVVNKTVMAFLSMTYKDRALIYQVVNKAVNKIKINL